MYKKQQNILSTISFYCFMFYTGAGIAAEDASLTALSDRVVALSREVQLLEDQNAIEILQRTYGFYMDKALWTQVADLFTDDGTLEIGPSGVFVGKVRVKDYLLSLGQEGPQEGRLIDQMQLQPVIHIANDGNNAKGRWRSLVMAGQHQGQAWWGSVIYENEYRKEGGVWKIARLHGYNIFYTDYAKGWAESAVASIGPDQPLAPDLPSTTEHTSYPEQFFVPFHYQNPVTGTAVDVAAAIPDLTPIESDILEQTLSDLNTRLERLNDVQSIERLQHVYGYYLDKQQWDTLANLVADDGTIEIAQRGIYAGKKRVRDNLNLYGEPGVHHGVLHNHIQLQPVIHVDADGRTAHARARALSMLGTYGRAGVWGASVYENEYVKENGIWKFKHDHLYTTMFTTYNEGWAAAPRAAPGVSKDNPPDLPPSVVYEAFPKTHIPPFHYPHPVTKVEVRTP
ncbi:MAG: hypothetical protein HW386_1929 [Gammaproteobacteria bacterium]|nr:hypothetical protein [Gammaproteobacteria bacterium]